MEVKTIAVTGAGKQGRAIALAAALGGYRTILEDVMPETLEKALAWMRSELENRIAHGEIEPGTRDAALGRVETAHSFEDASREAGFLFDAGPDEWELKLEIFTLFDKFARPGCVLASVTSLHSITDLAAMTYRPELCAGLRLTESVRGPRRVEIIRALQTSDETISTCREVVQRMSWEAIVVEEPPR